MDALLLTIGAGPLPETTPIIPVTTTPTVDNHTATPLAPPTGFTVVASVDCAMLSWTANGVAGSSYVIQTAPDVAGSPGTFADKAITNNLHYTLALSGTAWVRARAMLDGRSSAVTTAYKVTSLNSAQISTNASNITALQSTVAGKADVSAVEDLEARVTVSEGIFGVNLLLNAGLAVDAIGWGTVLLNDGADANWISGRDDQGPSYQVAGTHNLGCHNTGTTASGKNYILCTDPVAVDAGYDFIFSGDLAAANVNSCELRLYFYDAALADLGNVATSTVGVTYTGGTNPALWQKRYMRTTPPAGSKWMRLALRVLTKSASGARAHLMHAMIERASPGQTTPTAWNTGPTTAWAQWDIKFNVNGYISGISLASDGRSTAFAVAADVFQVRAPTGTDALTWQAGVISSRKGSKELKLGAGFGADPSGKRMILSYGAPVADASAMRATSEVWIAENGDMKLGSTQINYGSAWKTGAIASYTATAGTPATATISVTAGTYAIGGRTYSYDASSVGVTGTNGTSTTYYLYYEDPGLLGGTLTLNASTDPAVTYASDSKLMIGQLSVAFPSSGSGSGGGGGGGGNRPCVSVGALVMGRDGPMRAGDVRIGTELLLCDPQTSEEAWGVVTYSKRERVPGVRLRYASDCLTCSIYAPIPTLAGMLLAPNILGQSVVVHGVVGLTHVEVWAVEDVGEIDVQHITVGDRCFWASDLGQHWILHHNTKPPPEV